MNVEPPETLVIIESIVYKSNGFAILFIFLFYDYRVSLDPVILCGACGAPETRPGGRATLSCPPGPRLPITKFWQ